MQSFGQKFAVYGPPEAITLSRSCRWDAACTFGENISCLYELATISHLQRHAVRCDRVGQASTIGSHCCVCGSSFCRLSRSKQRWLFNACQEPNGLATRFRDSTKGTSVSDRAAVMPRHIRLRCCRPKPKRNPLKRTGYALRCALGRCRLDAPVTRRRGRQELAVSSEVVCTARSLGETLGTAV